MPKRVTAEKKTRKTRSDKGMSKRSRGDTLTGGTRDVNPQLLVIQCAQTGADASTITASPLPIPRYPQQNGKQIVMEILSADYYLPPNVVQANNGIVAILTTNPTVPASIPIGFADPRALDFQERYLDVQSSVGITLVPVTFHHDFTDEAGHGLLVATDNIYLACLSSTTGLTNTIFARLSYRFKEVTLAEYIGIVQSQQ